MRQRLLAQVAKHAAQPRLTQASGAQDACVFWPGPVSWLSQSASHQPQHASQQYSSWTVGQTQQFPDINSNFCSLSHERRLTLPQQIPDVQPSKLHYANNAQQSQANQACPGHLPEQQQQRPGRQSEALHDEQQQQQPDTPDTEHARTSNGKESSQAGSSEHATDRSSSTESSGSSSSNSSSSSKGPPDEALLAEWRTASSEWYGTGLNFIVHSHLDMPNLSSWSFLYKQPPGLISQLLWPQGASAMTRLLRYTLRQAADVAVLLLEEAHGDFELEGFKESASQAVASLLELYAAADWIELRPMVSSGLLQSMQHAYQTQQDAADTHNMQLSNVHVDVQKLDIVCVHSMNQQQLAAIDEQRSNQQLTAIEAAAAEAAEAAAAPAAAAVPYWDVVHLYAETMWHATVTADGVTNDVAVPKSGHWVLCRGPVVVNKAIPADGDKPWFMLAWM